MRLLLTFTVLALILGIPQARANMEEWKKEWPLTDFSKSIVDFDDIDAGGPPRDGIPAIMDPVFNIIEYTENIAPTEPVIVVEHKGIVKAYPLQILIWHELVNDTIGGMPIVVTFGPLHNASVVYDRRVKGITLDFGITGKLRHSGMIMYDKQTESWWQQFTGQAIVGSATETMLKAVPSKIMPYGEFIKKHPNAKVLEPKNKRERRYGTTPYGGHDTSAQPLLYRKIYSGNIPAMTYLVVVGNNAFLLSKLKEKRRVNFGKAVIEWHPGMNSVLDERDIREGRDIGYITIRKRMPDRSMKDIPFDVTFAFVFKEFRPDGVIHMMEKDDNTY